MCLSYYMMQLNVEINSRSLEAKLKAHSLGYLHNQGISYLHKENL